MADTEIIEVTPDNVLTEGLFCIKNPTNPGFKLKMAWLENRREEGLKLKVLKVNGISAGFVEYVPGEAAWRPVSASGYLFIHCMWVFPKKNLQQGYGTLLIQHCIEEAKARGLMGVVTVASKGSWLSGPSIFEKNGFVVTGEQGRYLLMSKKLTNGKDPSFKDWEKEAAAFKGLHLIYAPQCPLFIKSMEEMSATAKENGLDLKITELKTPEEAQKAPTGYGVYSLLYNGRVLADHYISNTRFKNILKKVLS